MTTESKKLRKPSEIRRDASGKFAKRETAAEILTGADVARIGQWTPEAKAQRLAEMERRRAQWHLQGSQMPQTATDNSPEAANASPAGNACDSCNVQHCDSHADGHEHVSGNGYTLSEIALGAGIAIALAAIAAFTLHAHGLI